MRKIVSLMFVLAISIAALAQTSLKGTVIDQATQIPVVGAKVTLANQNISTTTNSAGEYSLLYLDVLEEELIIEAEGYMSTIELLQLKPDQVNEMEAIELQ